jgi:hypothetical protein
MDGWIDEKRSNAKEVIGEGIKEEKIRAQL